MESRDKITIQTSATAIDLGEKLTRFIREYQGSHGGVTETDIRHALRLAEANTGVSLRRGTISVLMAGALLAAVFLFLLFDAAMSWNGFSLTRVAAGLGFLVLGLFFVYLVARR